MAVAASSRRCCVQQLAHSPTTLTPHPHKTCHQLQHQQQQPMRHRPMQQQQQRQQQSTRCAAEPQDRGGFVPPPVPPPPPPPPPPGQQAGRGGSFQQQQQQQQAPRSRVSSSATPQFQDLGWRDIRDRYVRPSYLPLSFTLGALTVGLRLGAANYTFADSPFEYLGTAVSTGVFFMALAWVLFDFVDEPPSNGSPPPRS